MPASSRPQLEAISRLLQDAVTYGNNDDPEYYKAVLRAEILLDADDEGLKLLA